MIDSGCIHPRRKARQYITSPRLNVYQANSLPAAFITAISIKNLVMQPPGRLRYHNSANWFKKLNHNLARARKLFAVNHSYEQKIVLGELN